MKRPLRPINPLVLSNQLLVEKIERAHDYIEFLEACREYDASGENRPEGYVLTKHAVGLRQSGKD